MEKNEKSILSVDEKIKLRYSWLKIIVVISLLVLGFIKFLEVDFSTMFSQSSLNDILSLVLAIFSICLSVAFYFKSCDTSNQFYDNTYKFTKDISLILARMETGFTEKLGHIEEYTSPKNNQKNEKENIEKQDKELSDKQLKIDDEITNLLKDKIKDKNQIEELKAKLMKQTQEYNQLENEKKILNEELSKLKSSPNLEITNQLFSYMFNMIRRNNRLTKDDLRITSLTELRIFANDIIENSGEQFIDDAKTVNIINSDNRITDFGLRKFKRWIFEHV